MTEQAGQSPGLRLQKSSTKAFGMEGDGDVVLKGTGFSPYINACKMSRALAPEGRLSISFKSQTL
jgi:hypothetical protein